MDVRLGCYRLTLAPLSVQRRESSVVGESYMWERKSMDAMCMPGVVWYAKDHAVAYYREMRGSIAAAYDAALARHESRRTSA
jgi:hypothetical protein